MSQYTQKELNDGVVTGFLSEKIQAWHQAGIDPLSLKQLGRAFDGPVPPETAEHMIGWAPVVIEPGTILHLPDGDEVSFDQYELPDRFKRFIGNPNTKRIVNVAGSGYDANLHHVVRDAIVAAADAGLDIASVVCLGDGAHLSMSWRAREGVTFGGAFGLGAVPLVSFNSSLTSAIKTTASTGTTLTVCDNTMLGSERRAVKQLEVKRTRNAAAKVTPSLLRETLEISFAETQSLVDELERLANIDVSLEQMEKLIDQVWEIDEDSSPRTQTGIKNQRSKFRLCVSGSRNPFGMTAAGLVQAYNTWQHWHEPARGVTEQIDRLGRQAERTATGKVEAADAWFRAQLDGILVPA